MSGLVFGTVAWAEEHGPSKKTTSSDETRAQAEKGEAQEQKLSDVFKAMDENGDGHITKEEGPKTHTWAPGKFEIKDLNDDGKLTLKEFTGWRTAPRTKKLAEELSEKTFTAMDSDGDEKIHKDDEWFGTPEDFKKKDLNGDGFISKEEAKKSRAKK